MNRPRWFATPRRVLGALVLGGTLASGGAAAQQGSTVIQLEGRVVRADGSPLSGVDVEVARGARTLGRSARTDRAGTFRLLVPAAARGTHALRFLAPGFIPRQRQITLTGLAVALDSTVLSPREPVRLTGVTVRAAAPVPAISRRVELERTGDEEWTARAGAALPAHLRGSLDAMAATVPGVFAAPGGISAFGLGPDANGATLNGLALGGIDVPRNLRSSVRVSRSAYDPARGGFAGVQTALTIGPSYGFVTRRGHVTLGGESASGHELPAGTLRTEAGVEGGSSRSLTYSAALALSRFAGERNGPALWDAGGLADAGVSRDSLVQLDRALRAAGLPSGLMRRLPHDQERATLILRADHRPYNPGTWSVLGFAQLDRGQIAPPSLSAIDVAPGLRSSLVGLQVAGTRVIDGRFLTDLTAGVTRVARRDGAEPDGIGGVVELGDPAAALAARAPLRFGSAGVQTGRETDWSAEAALESRWYPGTPRHLLKLYVNGSYRHRGAAARMENAVFHFPSVAAFRANEPSAFSAAWGEERLNVGSWGMVLAASDTWSPSDRLQLLAGVRAEAEVLTGASAASPDAIAASRRITALEASPRLGVTWAYGPRVRGDGTRARSPVAGILRAGVGRFRAATPLRTVGDAARTGSTAYIRCLGDAVAAPDWSGGTTPDAGCLDGGGAVDMSDGSRRFLEPGYAPPESWRGSVGWFTRLGSVNTAIEGNYSVGRHLPGWRDINFADRPSFLLAREGGRPVFSDKTEIDPATGAALGTGSRSDPAMGRMLALEAGLRSVGRQLTLRLSPDIAPTRGALSVAYTLSSSRTQFRGVDGGAFGSPDDLEWAPSGYTPRHQLMTTGSIRVRPLGYFSLYANLASGLPYTPTVAGDPNGDGAPGDRAFVFPAASGDPTSTALADLLGSAPSHAARCLRRFEGGPARRNGCRGGWSRMVNLGFSTSRNVQDTGRRLNLDLQVVNVLGGLDRLLHGDRPRGLDGGRQTDAVLYTVNGFDPDRAEFRYQVNPNFGRAHAGSSTVPFQVVLDFSFDWGPSIERQTIESALRTGGGADPARRPSVDEIRERLGYIGRNFYPSVQGMGEEIMLDTDQVQALDAAERRYEEEVGALKEDLARYLAALPSDYRPAEAVRRQRETDRAALRVVRAHAQGLREILTAFQLGLLPPSIRAFMTMEVEP